MIVPRAIATAGRQVLAACLSLLLAACAGPAPDRADGNSAPMAATASANAAAPVAAADAIPVTAAAATPQVAAKAPSPAAVAPDDRCTSDADCAVKDVGSCCGYRPHCVNARAETFPDQVKARCASEGRVGTCGFRAVTGCQCKAGHCADVAEPTTVEVH